MLTGGGHAPGSGQRTAFRCRPRPCRWPAEAFACSWSTSSEARAGMVKHPQDRLDAVRPVIEQLGGTIERRWLAAGEYDIVLVCQLPSTVSAEAFSMAASAGGAV